MNKLRSERNKEIVRYTSQAMSIAIKLFYDATERHGLTLVKGTKKLFFVQQGVYPKQKIVKTGTLSQCLWFIINTDRPVAKRVKNEKTSLKK